MSELEEQIEHVRVIREDLAGREQDLHEKQVAFNRENAALIEEKCRLMNAREEAEKKLRKLTLEAYQSAGSKKPAPGVGVRVVRQLHYDEAEALAWAIESGAEACLSLQKTNFKKVAEALAWAIESGAEACLSLQKTNFKKVAEGLALPFVRIEEVLQATIAKDL